VKTSRSQTVLLGVGAVGAVLGGGEAQAAVIQWVAGIVIPANLDGLYIKVDTQQTFAGAGSGLPGWDLNPYSTTGLTFFNATGTGMMRYPGVTTGSAGSLDWGTEVGPTRSFGSGAVVVGSNPGNWSLNAINYIGFRFVADGGGTHYGWAAIQVGSAITTRTFVSLNYESVANTPIFVASLTSGAADPIPSAVPETSTVAAGALAGLALGARFVIQRRRQATRRGSDLVQA
jgi:hypothetical protein